MVATPAEDQGNVASDGARLREAVASIERAFVGKREAIEFALIAMLARGHVLFEDVPGVGKTTLARSVAKAMGCSFKRIQFTSDLLPADIVGVTVYDRDKGHFDFRRGPIFSQVVLADEINRTTPRTQSALLEAMNERQVTVDDTTYPLEKPFMVMATQNPLEFSGTYPLPESQLDRFLVRITIGYPAPEVEREIIRTMGKVDMVEQVEAILDGAAIRAMQKRVAEVTATDPVLDYLSRLVEETRRSPYLSLGVSTRGALSFHRACQGHAYLNGREHLLPDDVKALFMPVCAHRVMVKNHHEGPAERRREADNVLRELLETTQVPL
ncbi:MAG: AAA family ATPase [Myxococcota bacterium]